MKEVLGIMLTGDEEAPSQKYESEEEVLDYHLNDTNGPAWSEAQKLRYLTPSIMNLF